MIFLVFINILALAWMGSSIYHISQRMITKRGAVAAPLVSLFFSILVFVFVLVCDYMVYSGIQC